MKYLILSLLFALPGRTAVYCEGPEGHAQACLDKPADDYIACRGLKPKPLTTRWVRVQTQRTVVAHGDPCGIATPGKKFDTSKWPCSEIAIEDINRGLRSDGVVVWR